ncbi:MAG: helix-turn-helix domain-containing protein [Ruminococcaceae bacterium]|nr:helix-turn-helix domain-containing protein [Oscillospiraceae bacterium]
MEKNVEAIKQQVLKNATLFTDLFGLGITWHELHDPAITDVPQSPWSISVCKNGLCCISIPICAKDTKIGYIISDPILCSSYVNKPATVHTIKNKNLQHSFPIVMRPETFEKMAHLLTLIVTPDIYPETPEIEGYHSKLKQAIKEGNPSLAQNIIDDAFNNFLIHNGNHFKKFKTDCIRFIMLLFTIMDNICTAQQHQKGWSKEFALTLSRATSIGSLKSCMNRASQNFVEGVFQAVSLKHNLLIQQAICIIQENYNKKLSHKMVASKVYISPSYFSKIFRESTGKTFTQFVNNIRIEKAKELLTNPSIPIHEISSMIGYEDRSYFGKIFRQLTQTTPKRYRDKILR